jgi:hypothetical protein
MSPEVEKELKKLDKVIKGKTKLNDDSMNEAFTAILQLCVKLHAKYPSWRFGQIIANALRGFDGRVDCDPFHIYNEDLEEGLKNLLKD